MGAGIWVSAYVSKPTNDLCPVEVVSIYVKNAFADETSQKHKTVPWLRLAQIDVRITESLLCGGSMSDSTSLRQATMGLRYLVRKEFYHSIWAYVILDA